MSDATMDWLPLELWRASSLAQETQTVTYKFDRVLKSGDTKSLNSLRASIEQRVDDLESFYVANVDDERGVLFEKQRLKLRKLLHSADASRGRRSGASESARLSLTELMAWFLREGHRSLPAMNEDTVAAFFNSLAPRSADGMVSIGELKAWYASPAGPAAVVERHAVAEDEAESGSASSAMSASGSRGANLAKARAKIGLNKGKVAAKQKGGKKKKKGPAKAVYAWEKALEAEKEEEPEPVGLVGTMEFQVRLTAAEYREYSLRRRNRAAERKHLSRAAKQRAAAAAKSLPGGETIATAMPYKDPSKSTASIYRDQDKSAWITSSGFNSNTTPTPNKGRD